MIDPNGAIGPIGAVGPRGDPDPTGVQAPAPVVPVARHAAPSKALGKLYEKAGLVKGVETSIALAADADHLLVIDAIAADGLSLEKTPERRLLLQGIRTAIERTLALQGVAQ